MFPFWEKLCGIQSADGNLIPDLMDVNKLSKPDRISAVQWICELTEEQRYYWIMDTSQKSTTEFEHQYLKVGNTTM